MDIYIYICILGYIGIILDIGFKEEEYPNTRNQIDNCMKATLLHLL